MNARDQLEAFASGIADIVTEHRVFELVVREKAAPEAIAALRAVLNIHKPYSDTDRDCAGCGLSSDEEPFPYPCDTVKAITTALEAAP